jgi:hypothetical protein
MIDTALSLCRVVASFCISGIGGKADHFYLVKMKVCLPPWGQKDVSVTANETKGTMGCFVA